MAMSRANIITLAGKLAMSRQNSTSLSNYMDEVFHDLAFLRDPQILEAGQKELVSGTSTYDFDSDMLRIIFAFMEDELLSPATEDSLDAYSEDWQSDTGTPTQITQDAITALKYRLYPTPDFSSGSPAVSPWGEDYADDILSYIYAQDSSSGILDIFGLPAAFDALSREFDYPSDHIDRAFAAVCRTVADIIYTLIGVK